MSDIGAELERVRAAFDRPTLKLLDRKWAPLVLASFSSSFSRDRRSILAERLHVQVESYLAELARLGEEVPQAGGRALCVQWMNDQWLYRSLGEGGEEEYSLTSHALEALTLVNNLSRDRALISESRLTTILDSMRHWAAEASPDPEERVRRLDLRIAELQDERDRLAGGGEVPAVSVERMFDGYSNLHDLIAQLPSDFKRVEESVSAMHRAIISEFRSEQRPIGEVLDQYLAKTDELMSATPEGRAFEGAFALLRNEELLQGLNRDIREILDHPFSERLSAAERAQFRATVAVIRRGIDEVLSQRSRLSSTLREHIVNHDQVRDRELDGLLRGISVELETWMGSAGARASVPVDLMPPLPGIGHFRERLYDPAAAAAPAPLVDVSAEAPPAPAISALRTQGGPLLAELREALIAQSAEGVDSAGEAFNRLESALRRPVEIFGLLHLLTQAEALDRGAQPEALRAVRPDRSEREFFLPHLPLTPATALALAALTEGEPDA